MKNASYVIGILFASSSAFGATLDLTPDSTGVTIDQMKAACLAHEANDPANQIQDFAIDIHCQKTESSWIKVDNSVQLPLYINYNASGSGKGAFKPSPKWVDIAAKSFACPAYQEVTNLFTGSIKLDCDELLQIADIVDVCTDGVQRDEGLERVSYVRTGEEERGALLADGCPDGQMPYVDNSEQKPAQKPEQKPVQKPARENQSNQVNVQSR